jgi:hypothetical protein
VEWADDSRLSNPWVADIFDRERVARGSRRLLVEPLGACR